MDLRHPITVDTNIYISALHFGGLPQHFLTAALAGAFRLAISEPLRLETSRVLHEKFDWRRDRIDAALGLLAEQSVLVHPTERLAVISDDPDDDRILECAVAAGSEIIVSGDQHLLSLGSFRGIRILRVAAFMQLLPPLR